MSPRGPEAIGEGQRYLAALSEGAAATAIARSHVRRLETLRQLLPSRGRLLDVGCEAGNFLDLARDRGWEAEGVEPSGGAARLATARGHRVHVGLLEEVDLQAGDYDAVTMWCVLPHTRDPRRLLHASRRLLRPGGILGLYLPNGSGLVSLLARLAWYASGQRVLVPLWTEHHPLRFQERTLRYALEASGFSIDVLCQEDNREASITRLTWNSRFREPKLRALTLTYDVARLLRRQNHLLAFARAA